MAVLATTIGVFWAAAMIRLYYYSGSISLGFILKMDAMATAVGSISKCRTAELRKEYETLLK